MKITLKHLSMALMSALLSLFVIFGEKITQNKYLFIGLCIAVLIVKSGGRFKLRFDRYYIMMFVFVVYAFLSSMWAWDPARTREKAEFLIKIFLFTSVIYFAYCQDDSVEELFSSIKWAGYIVAIYMIRFYGISKILNMLTTSQRMSSEDVTNSNVIGMAVAMGILCEILEFFKDKKIKWSFLLVIPSLLVIAASQSRKSLLIIVIGVLMAVILYSVDPKNKMITVFKGMALISAAVLLFFILSKLPLMSGIIYRMQLLWNAVTGESSNIGYSASIRWEMIRIGIEQFFKTPVKGIGFDCTRILSAEKLGKELYLHNNFVEMLCGGGSIGFILYYLRYFYPLKWIKKGWNWNDKTLIACFIICITALVMDYAFVSYYSIPNQIYFIPLFLQAEIIRRRTTKTIIDDKKWEKI